MDWCSATVAVAHAVSSRPMGSVNGHQGPATPPPCRSLPVP
jgi:hypothetical protein